MSSLDSENVILLNKVPLVSIGLPTHNRALNLKRAVESVLTQDYPNLELVISDNASTDETEIVCQQFCALDNRIRYFRQPINQGAVENFLEVLRNSKGEFFMWLADDDWLDRSYVSECLRNLKDQSSYALVCGKSKYFQGDVIFSEGAEINLLQENSKNRMLAYYRQVEDNGTFYGLMRREQLIKVPLRNVKGGDWLLIASIAFIGKIKTLETVSINRLIGGASSNDEFRTFNLYLRIAITVFKDIAQESPIYSSMSMFTRLVVAFYAAATIIIKYYMRKLRVSVGLRTRMKRQILNFRLRAFKVRNN
jgi:glycosyltransferase involved in cell wall biosynthesis